MKIFHYDRTGVLVGSDDAKLDPKRTEDDQKRFDSEVAVINGMKKTENQKADLIISLVEPGNFFLVPANATDKNPPTVKANEVQVFDGVKWSVVADHRGAKFHFPDQKEEFTMNEVGDLPSGAVVGERVVPDSEKWEKIRWERNGKLAETDWTVISDSPLTTAKQDKFKIYRQKLRDIPQNQTDPDNITWPVKP